MKRTILAAVAACMICVGCGDKGGGSDGPISSIVSMPSEVGVERTGATQIKVTWRDNSTNETGFSVWFGDASGSDRAVAGTVAAGVTEYTVSSGLTEGASYYFGVQANASQEKFSSKVVYISSPYKLTPTAELPGASIEGEPTVTATCIALSYKLANNVSGDKYGLCWSADGTPTVDDAVQYGPDLPSGGAAMLQAIPNALLDYGKTYKIRAFLTTSTGTYYSAEKTARLQEAPAAITLTWTRLTDNSLPAGIELYKTESPLNGRKFNAWYAVADVSGNIELRVNVPSAAKTLTGQFADANGNCYVLINGGYFYNGSHTGLAVVNGTTTPGTVSSVRGSLDQPNEPEEYNKMYYVTRGVFGVNATGKPDVYWAGISQTSSGAYYYYDRPMPTVKGEARYKTASADNPSPAITWTPRYAVSAGPALVYDGKIAFDFTTTSKGSRYYLSNYEVIPYDIFGTGVIPDRTAVGYLADGRVVLFVCDGRITGGSQGASLTELAAIMKGLGCVGAMNLDGGGSTGMVVGGAFLNDQSGSGHPRAVVSSVGFYKKQ